MCAHSPGHHQPPLFRTPLFNFPLHPMPVRTSLYESIPNARLINLEPLKRNLESRLSPRCAPLVHQPSARILPDSPDEMNNVELLPNCGTRCKSFYSSRSLYSVTTSTTTTLAGQIPTLAPWKATLTPTFPLLSCCFSSRRSRKQPQIAAPNAKLFPFRQNRTRGANVLAPS